MDKYGKAYLALIDHFNKLKLGLECDDLEFIKNLHIIEELVDREKPMEPIKGKIIPNSFEDIQTYHCKCGRELSFKDNYCSKCGQKLKRDEK